MSAVAGINGFGRFGLHLLKFWLDRHEQAAFRIGYINDEVLPLSAAVDAIERDQWVRFEGYRVEASDRALMITVADGTRHTIPYTNQPQIAIPWLGQPDVVFECSGNHTKRASSAYYLRDRTKLVMISATSWDADMTVVYGFNQQIFNPAKHTVVSYGSCTVNSYVPLANYVHDRFGLINSDVHVVHNITEYKLADHQTLLRKFCTLEKSGPDLLPFLSDEKNFTVVYTVVPYTGVPMIDFRFRLKRALDREDVIADLEDAIADGPLAGLYGIVETDSGPETHKCTPYSAVFIRSGIRMLGDNLYLPAYFDTENSVNRYFDAANYLIPKALG